MRLSISIRYLVLRGNRGVDVSESIISQAQGRDLVLVLGLTVTLNDLKTVTMQRATSNFP